MINEISNNLDEISQQDYTQVCILLKQIIDARETDEDILNKISDLLSSFVNTEKKCYNNNKDDRFIHQGIVIEDNKKIFHEYDMSQENLFNKEIRRIIDEFSRFPPGVRRLISKRII